MNVRKSGKLLLQSLGTVNTACQEKMLTESTDDRSEVFELCYNLFRQYHFAVNWWDYLKY